MTTITKERIELFIKNPLENGLTRGEQMELARIALASLEAEPVAKIIAHYPLGIDVGKQKFVQAIGELPDFGGYLFAAPPVPVTQANVAQAIENLKQKLVECNRYNYCADAVKGVEDACRAVSYSQADNQPASGNQAAESNRSNEWTGNPDIDNAIIMLDRIDTLENCDDDRIEAVKAVLRRLAVNYPVTPDGWISCSERMPNDAQWCVVNTEYGYYVQCWSEGQGWLGDDISIPKCDVINWMPLPEPPQEVK